MAVVKNREAVAVTVAHLDSTGAGAEDVVDAALQFAAKTSVDKLRLVADSEHLPALAVALATHEVIPDNLTLVETGHELNDEFVVVSSDFVLSLAS